MDSTFDPTVIDPTLAKRSTEFGSLSSTQIEFYDTEGYLVLPCLLSSEQMMPAQRAMEEKVDEIAKELYELELVSSEYKDASFETRLALLFKGLSDDEFLKYGRSWRERRRGYFDLMSQPTILDAVESLIGGEIFANPVYNTRPKVPKVAAGAVPWHQDKSYWPGANANPVITVWIPLVDATLENGCLHIWPRTHNSNVFSYHSETYSGTGFLEIDEEHLKKSKALPIPLKAGGAILFNDRCVHMSTPNNSNHVRWSVDLRYQPTDQDPMLSYGAGFLARSRQYPERIATLDDWLSERLEHEMENH